MAEVLENRGDRELVQYFLLDSVKAEKSHVEYSGLVCGRIRQSLSFSGMKLAAI